MNIVPWRLERSPGGDIGTAAEGQQQGQQEAAVIQQQPVKLNKPVTPSDMSAHPECCDCYILSVRGPTKIHVRTKKGSQV
jgi:hypothetical protein